MATEMIGIDGKAFDDMILKMYNIKEDLNTTFNNLNSHIETLKACYKTEAGQELVEKFQDFSNKNFPTVLDNIGNYITDLKTAKENTQLFDSKLSMQFEEI